MAGLNIRSDRAAAVLMVPNTDQLNNPMRNIGNLAGRSPNPMSNRITDEWNEPGNPPYLP